MTNQSINELRAQRLTICAGCEHLRQSIDQCKLCGCFMQIKTRIAAAKCPAGKW